MNYDSDNQPNNGGRGPQLGPFDSYEEPKQVEDSVNECLWLE